MTMSKLLWLHIKKSGGTSLRDLLQPEYLLADRSHKPQSFIQSDKSLWNDILNNYRTPLGDLQFKRMLFSKDHLYSDAEFERLFKFAFCREPVSRCVSQFAYLWRRASVQAHFTRVGKQLFDFDLRSNISWDFDRFLDAIVEVRCSDSNLSPYGLHFQTHTASMFDDVTDENGRILLNKIWRLEELDDALQHLANEVGADVSTRNAVVHKNKSRSVFYKPSRAQKAKITSIFEKDFDLYDSTQDIR